MKKKGFTLVEVLMGLCILGLISVVILPTINSSFKLSSKYSKKMEMIYLGEMSIEKIKAFENKGDSSAYILDTKVEDIINSFEVEGDIEVTLKSRYIYKDYEINLRKKQRGHKLWEVCAFVYPLNEGDGNNYVEYKALVHKQ